MYGLVDQPFGAAAGGTGKNGFLEKLPRGRMASLIALLACYVRSRVLLTIETNSGQVRRGGLLP